MALLESRVTKNIPHDAKLWRYMTLDKLINILSIQQLYFSPLNSYSETDPFEGLMPKAALDAMKGMCLQEQQNLQREALKVKQHLFSKTSNLPIQQKQYDAMESAIEKISNLHLELEKTYFRIYKSTVVNCWHQNEFESEAMWRLYSENNKGIAIQTTLKDLVDSIDDERVFLSEVKYIDFYDEDLKPKDCVVNGHTGPLLKRKSFEHEREVRLFFQPYIERSELLCDKYLYKHELVTVNLSKLISKIYISPYAKEPYVSSVKEVLKVFGIEDSKIIHSNLLNPDENLTRMF